MRHQRAGLRITVLGALVAAMLGAGTVAWAAWTSTGAGSVTAQAGTALAPTTSVTGLAVTGLLYPGMTGEAKVTITNPNPYPVKVTSVAATANPTNTGCSTPGLTFTAQSPSTGNSIGANGSLTLSFPTAVSMDAAAGNNCQGVTFSIPVQVTVVSG